MDNNNITNNINNIAETIIANLNTIDETSEDSIRKQQSDNIDIIAYQLYNFYSKIRLQIINETIDIFDKYAGYDPHGMSVDNKSSNAIIICTDELRLELSKYKETPEYSELF
jgi:hypothetical protein